MPQDATVWIQPLSGCWQALGTAYRKGVWAENLTYAHDSGGPLTCSFDLRRDPSQPSPDLSAWTPCDIEINAVVVWSGRVKGTPARDGTDRALNVQGEGWQAHLDDDQYVPTYVHTKMSDWRDSRSFLVQDLTRFVAAPTVTSDRGVITMGWAKGTIVATNNLVGITFDCGPSTTVDTIALEWSKNLNAPDIELYAWGTDSPNLNDGTQAQAFTFNVNTASIGVVGGFFSPVKRYIHVFLIYTGPGGTHGFDQIVRVSAISLYSSSSYQTGGVSLLKGSTIFRDALSRATLLLSTDRTRIDPAATQMTSIPDFWTDEPKSPRETIDAANAYYNYVRKVDELRRPMLAPLPTEPTLEVGSWTPLELTSSSQNSGDDIVNKVIGKATTPAGDPLLVTRRSVQLPGVTLSSTTATPTFNNPSFTAVGTSGWTLLGSGTSFTRTTTAGEFDSAPAGGKVTGSFYLVLGDTTGTYKRGVTYVIVFSAKASVASDCFVVMNQATPSDATTAHIALTTTFQTFSVSWTPKSDFVNSQFYLSIGPAATLYFDSLNIYTAAATLADKRGFLRSKTISIPASLPPDGVALTQICDTYLQAHKSTPFKGDTTITGPVREILTGKNVPPERLGMRTTELLRFAHLIDPDNGALGRDGRMVQVTYNLAQDQAAISMDNTDANFEAFQSRLALFSGVGT